MSARSNKRRVSRLFANRFQWFVLWQPAKEPEWFYVAPLAKTYELRSIEA
jgi:hypothetical protein